MSIGMILCLKISHDILDLSNIHTVPYRVTGQGGPSQSKEKKYLMKLSDFFINYFGAIYFYQTARGLRATGPVPDLRIKGRP
jgi:hypothetical protein